MLDELHDYLSAFEAIQTKTPAQSGLVTISVTAAQSTLSTLGYKPTQDGKYGPQTRNMWAQAATSRGLNPAFDRSSPTAAWVHPTTASVLMRQGTAGPATSSKPAMAARSSAKPTPRKNVQAAPAQNVTGLITRPVSELQSLLYGVGWTSKRLTNDGKFGPQTTHAWAVSANLRKLPITFKRVSGAEAAVDPRTYAKIKADGIGAATPTQTPAPSSKSPIQSVPVAAAKAASNGLLTRSVDELQKLLYSIGWTGKKLTNDGKFGPQTQHAWVISANLRKLPVTFTRVSGAEAAVDPTTYAKIKADSESQSSITKTSATKKPASQKSTQAVSKPSDAAAKAAPVGLVTKTVEELQSLLYAIGWTAKKLSHDGKYGPQTAHAWAISATTRKVSTAFVRISSTEAAVDPNSYAKIKADSGAQSSSDASSGAQSKAAAATKTSKKSPDAYAGAAIIKAATQTVLVLTYQQALLATGKFPKVTASGKWDKATEATFPTESLGVPSKYRSVWLKALPKLLSKDHKKIKLLPAQAGQIEQVAAIYRAKVVIQSQPEQQATVKMATDAQGNTAPMTATQAGAAAEAQAAVQAPQTSSGSGGPSPYPVDMPASEAAAAAGDQAGATMTPVTPPATADAGGTDAWNGLVDSMQQLSVFGPSLSTAVEAKAKTNSLSPEVQGAYKDWVASAKRVLDRTAQLIENTPNLRSAIDAAGAGTMGLSASMNGLQAYFAELAGASDTVISQLRAPFPVVTVGSTALAGLGQAVQAAEVAVEAAPWIARFGSAAWKGLIQLLSTKTVAVVGASAVVSNQLSDVINGEVKSYNDYNQHLSDLVAKGELSPEDAAKLGKGSPISPVTVGVLGAAAVGALYVFMKTKSPSSKKAR